MTPVFLALDLARIAREHPAVVQRLAECLGGVHQRARDSMTDGFRLRRDSAARHAHDNVVGALGLGDFEGLEDLHARGITRKIDFECAVVDADGSTAGREPHPRDRGLALADGPDFRLPVCHLAWLASGPAGSSAASRAPPPRAAAPGASPSGGPRWWSARRPDIRYGARKPWTRAWPRSAAPWRR